MSKFVPDIGLDVHKDLRLGVRQAGHTCLLFLTEWTEFPIPPDGIHRRNRKILSCVLASWRLGVEFGLGKNGLANGEHSTFNIQRSTSKGTVSVASRLGFDCLPKSWISGHRPDATTNGNRLKPELQTSNFPFFAPFLPWRFQCFKNHFIANACHAARPASSRTGAAARQVRQSRCCAAGAAVNPKTSEPVAMPLAR